MKKILFLTFIVSFLWTCKKGENDPAISFRTRKSRVVGEWTMKKGSGSITINDAPNPPFNQAIALDGSKAYINETEAGNVGITYVTNYTFYIYFYKDGKFKVGENFGGDLLEASGTWNFLGRVGEAKNKESIILKIDKVEKGYTRENLFNKLGTEVIYEISELRNKVLHMHSYGKPYINANGKYASFTCDYLLEQR